MTTPPLRVLVVDDEDAIRELMGFVLRDFDCDVETAVNGREAVEKVTADEGIDLVFMDIMMPEMNGVEAFRHMRRLRPGLKVVMVSGFGREVETLKDEALANGALRFIPKPFSIADIRDVVTEVRDGRA